MVITLRYGGDGWDQIQRKDEAAAIRIAAERYLDIRERYPETRVHVTGLSDEQKEEMYRVADKLDAAWRRRLKKESAA